MGLAAIRGAGRSCKYRVAETAATLPDRIARSKTKSERFFFMIETPCYSRRIVDATSKVMVVVLVNALSIQPTQRSSWL